MGGYQDFAYQHLDNFIKLKIGQYHRTSFAEFDDLLQAGRLKVIEHLSAFDPYKSAPTTFFDYYIKEGFSKELFNDDSLMYYEKKIVKLNKVAQEAGYTDCFDPLLTTQVLSILSGEAPKTIIQALKYKTETSVASLDEISENQDIESRYDSPEKAYIKKEKKETINRLFDTLLTSFEKWLITNVAEDVSMNYMLKKLKEEEFRANFTDDEVIEVEKFNKDYLNKRIFAAKRKLMGSPVLKNYGTIREKYVYSSEDEQASYEDIASAFAAEEELFPEVG